MKPCAACLQPTSKHCSGCHIARYCSAPCQKSDWNAHKVECVNKCTNYDTIESCNRIVARLVNDTGMRAHFADMVRAQQGAHGICVTFCNAHDIRLTLTTGNTSVEANFLTEKEQYADTPPISVTGRNAEKEYVLLVQVYVPTGGNLCASIAMAVSYDVHDKSQMHVMTQ